MFPRHDITFGLLLTTARRSGETEADVYGRTLRLAEHAEELGFDDLWVTEHHFNPAVVGPCALTLAGYLLGVTTRIRVGTAVTVLPLHEPLHVAERANLLDHLSSGRFTLGVGRGVPGVEFDLMGEGLASWHAGIAGPLDRLLAGLRGTVPRPPGDEGPRPRLVPAARTGPHPPVYVAAGSPASIGIAAARGLPVMLFFDKDVEAKAEMSALYRRAARGAALPDPQQGHAFAVFTQVTESERESERLMREQAEFTLALNTRSGRTATTPPDVDHVVHRLLTTQPVGGSERCVDRLLRHIAASGGTRVMCQVEAARDTASGLRNLERLATEVFPAVRKRARAFPAVAGV